MPFDDLSYPFIDDGQAVPFLHSPFVIAVRARVERRSLVETLGMGDWVEHAPPLGPSFDRWLVVLESPRWTAAADSWHYTLWHDPELPRRLERLAEVGDVLAFAMGDSDESWDFWYFRDGERVRRRVVESV
ncbi:MAG: hypothetical protein AAF211_32545 [Myxococcota bacterium]